MSMPYYRDWSNMRHHKGKTFFPPPALFKASKALYFPNLHGVTLYSAPGYADTTPVFEGKISVLTMFSSAWAENQIKTWVDPSENPELQGLLEDEKDDQMRLVQRVDINYEDNGMKAAIIKLFMNGIRRSVPSERHERYFVIKNGIEMDMRDAIGFLNSKVGYVYLIDAECKIRWAGSGIANDVEKASLVKAVRKLAEDKRGKDRQERLEAKRVAAVTGTLDSQEEPAPPQKESVQAPQDGKGGLRIPGITPM
jgi:mitochondrial ATPase complex subunit ATP10